LQQLGSSNIAVSVTTKAELFYGARDKHELAKIERHLSICRCYGLSDTISGLFIEIMSRYSLNIKDFKFIPELKVYPITL
jgi:tRNA(fMet)-specific endonuclease VapC